MAAGEDYYYYSDSDDDDDVDRYVFLARQPGQHVEEDASDGVDEETDDEGGGDGRRGKRPLIRDASDAASPSPDKKARLGLIIAFPLAEQTPMSSTDQATSSPCGGARTGSCPEARGAAAMTRTNAPALIRGKEKPKRPLVGVSGKRSRSSSGCKEEFYQEPRRDVMKAAEKTSPSSAATSARRFQCNLCERCFDNHQALGGHVLGHQKKARIAAIAAAGSLNDPDGRGNRTAGIAVVEPDGNNGVGYAEQKRSVAAIGANGSYHEKAFGGIDDAACHEDNVDRGGHRKAKKKKPSIVAEEHMAAHGDGSIDMRASMFATSHEGVNDHDRNREEASGRGFHNGNEETTIGAGSHNDADVRNKKAAAGGASRKGGVANGNSNVDAYGRLHKCKVCGAECLTGRALGGHMRKHRKQPAEGAMEMGCRRPTGTA